jgi:hypothetical protein
VSQEVSVSVVVVVVEFRRGGILNEGDIEWYCTLVCCCIAKVGQEVSVSIFVVVVWRVMTFTAFTRAVIIIFVSLNEG